MTGFLAQVKAALGWFILHPRSFAGAALLAGFLVGRLV